VLLPYSFPCCRGSILRILAKISATQSPGLVPILPFRSNQISEVLRLNSKIKMPSSSFSPLIQRHEGSSSQDSMANEPEFCLSCLYGPYQNSRQKAKVFLASRTQHYIILSLVALDVVGIFADISEYCGCFSFCLSFWERQDPRQHSPLQSSRSPFYIPTPEKS